MLIEQVPYPLNTWIVSSILQVCVNPYGQF